jgi:hypothetical protein
MFFIFHLKEVTEDFRYVCDRYFPDFQDDDPTIAKGTRLKQQRLIIIWLISALLPLGTASCKIGRPRLAGPSTSVPTMLSKKNPN